MSNNPENIASLFNHREVFPALNGLYFRLFIHRFLSRRLSFQNLLRQLHLNPETIPVSNNRNMQQHKKGSGQE